VIDTHLHVYDLELRERFPNKNNSFEFPNPETMKVIYKVSVELALIHSIFLKKATSLRAGFDLTTHKLQRQKIFHYTLISMKLIFFIPTWRYLESNSTFW
jgi:hypothetical protein